MKPAYPKNRKVRSVSRDARLLNIHLWNLADDEGRLQELTQWILGEVFPTDDDVNPGVLREWLRELSGAGLIEQYEVDGERYIQCHDFNDHQRIEKPRPSELPPPPRANLSAVPDGSRTSPGTLPEPSRPEEEGEGEGKGSREREEEVEAASPEDRGILERLDHVAFSRGVASPKVDAALKVCADFAALDLAAEVEKFAHFWIDGPGEKRAFTDAAWHWRNWLGNVKPERPATGKGNSARSTVDDDLRRMEDQAAQLRAREEAA